MSAYKLKTVKNDRSPAAYVKGAEPKALRHDGEQLLKIFSEVTKAEPKMWGDSIVGYGDYHYISERSGQEGDWMATGFSLRKSGPTLYIMPGYTDYGDMLAKLGPHKLGKSCLYLKSLEGIHIPTLKKIIKAGLRDLKKQYKVKL